MFEVLSSSSGYKHGPKVVWSLRTYTKCGGDNNNNNLDRTTLNNNINKNNYYNTIYGDDTQIRCESELRIDSANTSYAYDDYTMYILIFYNTKGCTWYAMRRPHSKTRQGKKSSLLAPPNIPTRYCIIIVIGSIRYPVTVVHDWRGMEYIPT